MKSALAALAALSQESRLAIFRHLVEAGPQGCTAGSIGSALKLPAATLSFHLKELTQAQLLIGSQEGRFIRYAANFDTMNRLVEFLTENCCGGQAELCAPACTPTKPPARAARTRKKP